MQFSDKIAMTGRRKLADGRMVVDARFARAGIYLYDRAEVGLDGSGVVRVYRPPEEVFSDTAMRSFAHRAVTDNHPPVMVDANNWGDYAKGYTDGEVKRDGEFVRVPMMLADAGLVTAVDTGKKELSAGYDAELDFQAGTTPDGEAYDALMHDIRGNHIAVVDKGRAGAECSIADKAIEGADTMNTKTITFDGLPVVVTDAGEAVIIKLQGLLKDAGTALETAQTTHSTAIAAKDKELGERDATIADLKAKVLTDEQLDAKVAERATLLNDVALVAPKLDVKGKGVADARRAAVTEATAEADRPALKDKSDDYIAALFDALVNRAKTVAANDTGAGTGERRDTGGRDPLTAALGDQLPDGGRKPTRDGAPRNGAEAYQAMRDRVSRAWEDPDAANAA